jgi:acyl CoA:acetate/3-ketoacid CoA transferase
MRSRCRSTCARSCSGASANPDAVVSHGEQFDFYDGGGLDLAFLGLAQVSFNGAHSAGSGTRVLYIAERAVFEMRGGRLTVTEIAPGIDLEREMRAQIAPGVGVADDLKTMAARIFRAQPMLRRP